VVFLLVLQLRRLVRINMWSCDERKRIREVGFQGSSDKVSAPRRWLTFDGTALGTQWFFILNSARWSKRHICAIFRGCRHREARSLFLHRRFFSRMRHQKTSFLHIQTQTLCSKILKINPLSVPLLISFRNKHVGFRFENAACPSFPSFSNYRMLRNGRFGAECSSGYVPTSPGLFVLRRPIVRVVVALSKTE
jgi:hypothetical protein